MNNQSMRRLREYEELMEHKEREGQLKHHGVKGMKWGVRRYQPYQPGDGQKGKGTFKGKRQAKKEDKKRANQKVRMTVTNKEGASSTYSMTRSAAEKFEKKAKKEGMKTNIEEVKDKKKKKKKKIKQSDVNELVNDEFLKHGIDLGEFYDRES